MSLYFKLNEVKPYPRSTRYLEKINVLHVNIGSIKRNFENIKALLEVREFIFNIICVSKTCCLNTELQNNLNLSLTGFDSVPYERSKKSREGAVLIFIKKNLSCKIRKDPSQPDNYKKSTVEKKPCYLIGDLTINCLEYFENEKISTFYNSVFEYGAITLINKPIQVVKTSVTVIENVVTTKV